MTPAQIAKANLFSNKVYYGNFSRVGTAANGNVSYTGIGFKPGSLIMTYGQNPGQRQWGMTIWGNDISGVPSPSRGGFCWTSQYYPTDQIALDSNGNWTNVIIGSLSSLDSDGFTITWSKIGSPTHTLLCYYFAIP